MKPLIFLPLLLLLPMAASSGSEEAVAKLDADLVPIYESLVAEGPATELAGKVLELTLDLKFASEKYLLFTDTQIVVDKETRYYLIKWKYSPVDINAVLGKSNVKCKVKARIIEVRNDATSPGMPYVVAELLSIELQ